MAEIINLTLLRNIDSYWENLSNYSPYSLEFHACIKEYTSNIEFKNRVSNLISQDLQQDNVDLLCYLVEEFYPELVGLLVPDKKLFYIENRIKNCINYIKKKPLTNYTYAFSQGKYQESDSRVQFLNSVLEIVPYIEKGHSTISELLETPYKQFESMIFYVAFYPDERIPYLLEKLSYINKISFNRLTILPIGNYKHVNSFKALQNLEKYHFKNKKILSLIYLTMQKLAFNLPRIK